MHGDSPASDRDRQQPFIAAYLANEQGAADRLHDLLQPTIRHAVLGFLDPDHKDSDDVIQDTLLAVMGYVQKREGFDGNIESFAATVARNRCRDIIRFRQRHPQQPIEPFQDWIADKKQSPLDHLAEKEVQSLVRRAVASLEQACRQLLETLFFAGETIEQARLQLGLGSVQAVYYRRDVCLGKVLKILKNRLSDRS